MYSHLQHVCVCSLCMLTVAVNELLKKPISCVQIWALGATSAPSVDCIRFDQNLWLNGTGAHPYNRPKPKQNCLHKNPKEKHTNEAFKLYCVCNRTVAVSILLIFFFFRFVISCSLRIFVIVRCDHSNGIFIIVLLPPLSMQIYRLIRGSGGRILYIALRTKIKKKNHFHPYVGLRVHSFSCVCALAHSPTHQPSK